MAGGYFELSDVRDGKAKNGHVDEDVGNRDGEEELLAVDVA